MKTIETTNNLDKDSPRYKLSYKKITKCNPHPCISLSVFAY